MISGREWLKKEIKPYRIPVVVLSIATAFSTALSVAFAFLTKYLVNFAAEGDVSGITCLVWILVGSALGRVILQSFIRYYTEKTRTDIAVGLRSRLFKRIMRADYSAISSYHSGDLVSRLGQDAAEVASDTVGITPTIVGMATQAVGSLGALFFIDKLFTALLVAGGLCLVGITTFFKKKLKRYQREIMVADARSRSFMQESFSSAITVKAYGAEEKIALKSAEILDVYARRRVARAKLNSFVSAIYMAAANCGTLFAVAWCSVGLVRGEVDYGSILSVVLLTAQLQRPFSSVSTLFPVYYSRLASAERLAELDSVETEEIEAFDSASAVGDFEKIRCDRLSFSYDGDLAVDDLSFEVKRGETALVVGESGVGKSTLFKLLLGVYKPNDGEITLDGEFGSLPVSSKTRSLFAYVPQGNFLFSGTIRENLEFFIDKDDENKNKKIEMALRAAAATFVYDLPDGLESKLGERGLGLSEGQLQRLAVARSLASDRPILLLDEASSALDARSEKEMLSNIAAMSDKTVLMISHRQCSSVDADRIIEIKKKR